VSVSTPAPVWHCPERHVQRLRHPARNVGLHLEHVGHRGVELLPPVGLRRRTRAHVNQFRGHPDSAHAARRLGPLHRGGEEILRFQLAGDLLRRLLSLAVLVGAAPGDDGEARDLGQLRAQIVGHAVSEIGISRVTEIFKGEHSEPFRRSISTGGNGAAIRLLPHDPGKSCPE
jgi:hypothetical protein